MAEEKRYFQFDGNNFSNWKYRVRAILDEKDILDYIERTLETITAAVPALNAEEVLAHTKNEKKCKSILIKHIGDNYLEYVKDKETAKGIYDTLGEVFERKTISGQLYLRKKLLTLKYNDNENMNDHILEFDKTVRELKSIGAKMEDLDIVCNLLLTLPRSYDTIVTALETMKPEALTLEFVKSRLLDEYTKRNSGNETHSQRSYGSESVAMTVKKFKPKCFNCGKIGHKSSECRSKNRNNEGNGSYTEKRTANIANDEDSVAFSAATSSMNESLQPKSYKNRNISLNAESSGDSKHLRKLTMVLDSGATDHMVNDENAFTTIKELDTPFKVNVAKQGVSLNAEHRGQISGFLRKPNNELLTCNMNDVLLIKDLTNNLLSISKLEKSGLEITFKEGKAFIKRNKEIIATAVRRNRLYEIEILIEDDAFAGTSSKQGNFELWHQRMGHLNITDLRKLSYNEMVLGIPQLTVDKSMFCEPCVLGKQTRKPFSKDHDPRSNRPLEIIHSDVCGPIDPITWNGGKYFVTFIDDYSHFSAVYIIMKKSEVLQKFKEYVALCTAKFNTKIKKLQYGVTNIQTSDFWSQNIQISILRADNGGEYISNEFKSFCADSGIQMSHTVPYTPEQNGVAERFNRTILEKTRTMIIHAGLEKRFWNEALQAANYLLNRSPTNALKNELSLKTPAEIWHNKKPNLKYIRTFGSVAYYHIPKEQRKKLDPKATKAVLMGFAPTGYRLWNQEKQCIIIARDVTFDENMKNSTSGKPIDNVRGNTQNHNAITFAYNSDESEDMDNDDDKNGKNIFNIDECDSEANESHDQVHLENNLQRRKSNRKAKPVVRYGFDKNHGANICEVDEGFAFNAEQYVKGTPTSLTEAKKSPEWKNWKEGIKDEYKSLMENNTWTLTELPKDRKTIKCKWTFKIKRDHNGNIERFKARLVAKGFSQVKGFDYNETFAPVAKLTTFRVLMALANHEKLFIHQMDVKTAFLNGDLNEDIYMEQPEGFTIGSKVCKLNKALYGLKQSPRMWNERFNAFTIKLDLKRREADCCLYISIKQSTKLYLLLFVDDMLIISNSIKEIELIKEGLHNEFQMTDMSEAQTFVGIHIERDINKGTMKLSQQQYSKDILGKFEMTNCKSSATPMEIKLKLEDSSIDTCEKPYRELVGCLMYISLTTRPDLASTARYFSQFQTKFNDDHFSHAKRMLRYMKGTVPLGLNYILDEKSNGLIGYADSDFGSDITDRKSVSGYVFKVYGCTVSWISRKQQTVSLSSTEAEYIALATAACEAIWLRGLLKELGHEQLKPTRIYEDNQGCISVAQDPKEHKRMKHIDIKYNFLRDIIAKQFIELEYIPSANQLADIMTKALPIQTFQRIREAIGLAD